MSNQHELKPVFLYAEQHSVSYWIEAGYKARKHSIYNSEDPAEIDAIVLAEMLSDKVLTTLYNTPIEHAWSSTIRFIDQCIGKSLEEWNKSAN